MCFRLCLNVSTSCKTVCDSGTIMTVMSQMIKFSRQKAAVGSGRTPSPLHPPRRIASRSYVVISVRWVGPRLCYVDIQQAWAADLEDFHTRCPENLLH